MYCDPQGRWCIEGWADVAQAVPESGASFNSATNVYNMHVQDWANSFTHRVGHADLTGNLGGYIAAIQSDNSINFTVNSFIWNAINYVTDQGPFPGTTFQMRLYDHSDALIYTGPVHDGSSWSSGTIVNSAFSQTINVPPGANAESSGVIRLGRLYNDSIETGFDDEFILYMRLWNYLPPDFRPGMTRHNPSSTWQSDNAPEGMNLELRGGSWGEVRSMNPYTGDPAQARYFHSGQGWRAQDKIGLRR